MRNWIIRWTERFLRWRMIGKPVYVVSFGQTVWGGTIMGVQIDEAAGEVTVTAFHATDGVVPLDTGHGYAPILRFPLSDKLSWNPRKEHYEVDADGLDPRGRRHPEVALGGGAHRPRDRQAHGQEPQHRQGPPEAAEHSPAQDRRSHREGSRGVPPRHDAPSADQGAAHGANDPGPYQDARRARHARTLTLAVDKSGWIPDGILIGVSPSQHLHIYRLDMEAPPMPDGTVIWANAFTAEEYSLWTHEVLGDPEIH